MTKLSPENARILIVDDQEANLLLLEDMLQGGGYRSLRFISDSRQCLDLFREFQPDLVLLDLMMPHLDGFGVMDQIRPYREERGLVPVLVLTADANPVTKRHALAAGATDFLSKPLDDVEILLRIKNLLESRSLYMQLQQRADRKIQEQADLLNRANDAIFVRDMQDRITFWNQGAERLFGWTSTESTGRDADELLSTNPATVLNEAKQAMKETGNWSGDLRHRTKGGEEVVVASRWTLVHDDDGKPNGKLVINTNVTEMKKLEAQYLRAQRMESIGLLAGGIAHDLNNILCPITMGVDLLKMRSKETESLTLLAMMQTSVHRGAELVKQVLTFARGMDGQHQPLQLEPLVSDLVKLLEHTLPKTVTIQKSVPKDLWLVSADSTQLHQVLTNLCVNARDAMPDGGQLTITASNQTLDENHAHMNPELHPGPYVVLEVADTGTGIPPDVIDKIFEPFFTTKAIGKGTGLGLSTVLGIIKNHGGVVNVSSEVGKGSRFKVYLPALESSQAKRTDQERDDLPLGKGELILVIDDEVALRHLAQAALTAAGYRVVTAQNGAEGVSAYAKRANEIQVVLTDMMMPVMDGPAAIRALRRINPDVKIIAASGLAVSGEAENSSDLGVSAFVPKPYTVDVLLTTLRSVLESSHQPS